MTISNKEIEDIILKNDNTNTLVRLIVDYSILIKKNDNKTNGSWYSQKGSSPQKEELAKVKKEFEERRNFFNETPIDAFIEKINKNKRIMEYYEEHGMNTMKKVHYVSLMGENDYLIELISLKSRIQALMPIEYYFHNPTEFLKILG